MNGFLQGGGSEPSERSGSGGDVFETVSLQDGLQEDAIGRSSLSRLGEDITHRNGNSGGNVGGLTINFEELFQYWFNEVGSLVLYTHCCKARPFLPNRWQYGVAMIWKIWYCHC